MTPTSGSAAVPLAHATSGDGPLAVVVHGITENHHSFDPLLPLLRRHLTVLTVDLRGHGDSPDADSYGLDELADDIAAVVAETAAGLGGDGSPAPAPLLIGHSLGGLVAAVYAARHPARGVINIDQSLDLASLQGQVMSVAPLLRGDGFDAVISGMFAQMYGALPAAEQARVGALRRPVQLVVLGIWAPMLDLTPEDLARAIDAAVTPSAPYPYLQIDGIGSGPDYPAWLSRRIPGAVVDDWGALGHYPHLCQPERFVDAVRRFDPAL